MNASRRQFLKTSLATGSLVSLGITVPDFLTRTALAAPLADKKGAKDTILVVVQLTGGNDGLNTVVPFADPEYAKLRPTLKLPTPPAFHVAGPKAVSPLALAGAPMRVPSISSLEDFQLRTSSAGSGLEKKEQRALMEGAARPKAGEGPGLLDFVQRTAVNTYASSQRLQEIGKNYQPRTPYPSVPLANHLKLAAQLIDADLGARIFYVSIDGFDTHANQLDQHATLLRQLSDSMTAFYKDMAARGQQDRILMMTFSEFGRRPYENGSKGTDHGAAAPMFLVGPKVKAGPVGKHPSLTDHNFGNLKHSMDFRQVYAAILDKWLGVSSKEVLGQTFEHAAIWKS